jgi:flagellar biosynthesis/type III secretory pathway protein FliH
VVPEAMNMLSKIVSGEKVKKLQVEKFKIPSCKEIGLIIEEKKREAQRKKIIESNKEDPVRAAKKEANRILIEAQEKLKEAEAEASLLKIQMEKELRTRLGKEYQGKLQQQVKQVQQNYFNSLEELATLKQIIYNQLETQLTDLVFSVSHKVIGTEIKTSPEILLTMLKKGFDKIKDAIEYEIKVNPADYETIINKKDEIKEILKTSGSVKFTKDEQIERGGCQIITEQGEISSEPSKQLDIIKSELSDEPGA